MDDASKRTVTTLIMGSAETPTFEEAPTLARDASSRSASASTAPPSISQSSRPPSGVRRTIRGSVPSSSRPPAVARSTPPAAAVMVDQIAYEPEPDTHVMRAIEAPSPAPQWTPYALPPLPPTRPEAVRTEGLPSPAPVRSSSRGSLAAASLAVALVMVTLLVALGFTRRASPTPAIAPATAPHANVSLLYDGGAAR